MHLIPAFGEVRLDATPAQVEIYKSRKLDQGLARKSINDQLTVLRRALAIGLEWGLIASVPVIRWLDLPPADFDFLTAEEARRLMAQMPSVGA